MSTTTVRGQWFDSLSRYWREFARPGPLRERRYDEAARDAQNMFRQPEHGTLARRVRVAPGETRRVRFAITWNYPLGSIYWFNRAQPGDPGIRGRTADLAQLLRDAMGGFARQRRRSVRADGMSSNGATCRLPRFAVRFVDCRPRSSTRCRGTLGVLRTATVIRLEGGELWGWEGQHIARRILRGQLHPCLELSAGAGLAVPGAGADAARDRIHATTSCRTAASRFASACRSAPASTSSAPAPTGISARSSRPIANGGTRATTTGCSRYWPNIRRVDRICLVARQSRPLGPGQDRRPLGPPASHARHGAVRAELLADEHVSRGAEGRGSSMADAMGEPDFADAMRDARRRRAGA